MIPTFHCARFLRQTLENVLSGSRPGHHADRGHRRLLDPGMISGAVTGSECIFSGNPKASVTRVILKLVFSVRVGLGRRGECLMGGEDFDLAMTSYASGLAPESFPNLSFSTSSRKSA
jgi:hypothetical protein